jgi:hypothetical protein
MLQILNPYFMPPSYNSSNDIYISDHFLSLIIFMMKKWFSIIFYKIKVFLTYYDNYRQYQNNNLIWTIVGYLRYSAIS